MGLVGTRLAAQPAVLIAPQGGGVADQDSIGVPARLFESPNLDRFLRRANDFLEREDFDGAIKVLQDVLEGRTLVAAESETESGELGGGGQPGSSKPGSSKSGDSKAGRAKSAGAIDPRDDNPSLAVFSADDRLYRPVRRLCHELLAQMPPPGRELYRERFEVAARHAYDVAWQQRDASALRRLAERYFVTLTAARALATAGDLRMHEGRFRAAIQLFATLLQTYPEDQRRLVAGLDEVAIETKMAVCYALIGEPEQSQSVLDALGQRAPDETVRLMGELVAVAKLRESEFFRPAHEAIRAAPVRSTDGPKLAQGDLVPLWEQRFAESTPYTKTPRASGRQSVAWVRGTATRLAGPRADIGAPGGLVGVDGDQLLFFENFRLHVRDARSGVVRALGDGEPRPSAPAANQPRQRVSVYDHATMRPRWDDERYYAIVAPRLRGQAGLKALLQNELVAYDRETMVRQWSTGLQDGVTCLAAPTVSGRRLFLPVMVRDAVAMDCRDVATGKLRFRVWLHSGGSSFSRPPAVPVAVHMGTAYCATSAGVLAAIDAFSGDLLWLRRYERLHPLRPKGRFVRRDRTQSNPFGMARIYRERALMGFFPSDLIAIGGRIVLAPADGRVLLCLDGASGEILWLHSKRAAESDRYIVGHDGRSLFVGGSSTLLCIDLQSGLRRWSVAIPGRYHGRGTVTDSQVVMPGLRAVYTLPTDGSAKQWTKIELPAFSVGRDPLRGPSNLVIDGAYLSRVHAGGVEVFGSIAQLRRLAAESRDPIERARFSIQAGDLVSAIGAYEEFLRDDSQPAAERERVARRMMGVARDIALAMGAHGAKADALSMLDRVAGVASTHGLAPRLHMARVELYRELGEAAEAGAELERLYRAMSGTPADENGEPDPEPAPAGSAATSSGGNDG